MVAIIRFGLRGAWAAGVRSRLPAAERDFFQEILTFVEPPLHWIHSLPKPKDAATLIGVLEDIPPEDRIRHINFNHVLEAQYEPVLNKIMARGRWLESEVDTLLEMLQEERAITVKRKVLQDELDWWANTEEFGHKILSGLKAYHEVFFAEDEARIASAINEALGRAQELAANLSLPELLEELSQGVRFTEAMNGAKEEMILVPTFWLNPLIVHAPIAPKRWIMAFGGRPANSSLVPGDAVPDGLFRALKALADPTRLRILRYLMAGPSTPAELARKLRLRPPTVIHHLHILRLASLIQLTLEGGERRRYAARPEMIQISCAALSDFLEQGD